MAELARILGRLEATVEAIADSVLWMSGDCRIAWVNRAGCELLGSDRPALVGAFLPDVLPLHQSGVPIDLAAALQGVWQPGGIHSGEFELQRGDCTLILHLSGQWIEPGQDAIAIVTLRDITPWRQLEARSRRQEAALQAAETRYRTIVENATQGIYQMALEGQYLSINPTLARLMGYNSSEDFVERRNRGEPLYIHEECRQEVLRLLQEEGVVCKLESQVYRNDGSIIWIAESARVICDEAGQPLYYQGFIEDITDRKVVEQEREEYLSILRATLESTADGILVINRDRNVPVYNQKFLQMWNLPAELLLPGRGEERLTFLANQTIDPTTFKARIFELFVEHPEEEAMDLVEFKDGRVFERFSQPQWIGNEIVGRVWGFRDITGRKRAEEALQRQAAAIRASIDGIGILDASFTFIYLNESHLKMYGYDSAMEFIGRPWTVLYDEAERHRFEQYILPTVQQQGQWQGEAIGKRKDGSTFPQEISLSCLQDGGIVCLVRDITARKQAEEHLRQQQEFLRTVIDTDPNSIFVKDWDGRYLLANKAAAAFYNKTVEEIIGGCDHEFHPDAALVSKFMEENRQVIETGQGIFIAEEKLTNVDYDEWFQWQKQPLKLPGSDRYSVLGIGVNITERKRIEERLQSTTLRLSTLITNLQSGILLEDESRRIVLTNPAFCTLFQLTTTPEELSGLNCQDALCYAASLFHDSAWFTTRMTEIVTRRELVSGEEWVLQDGRILERDYVPIFEGSEYRGHLWLYRDISDRKRLEEELLESRQFLNTIIERIPIALFVKDVANDFRYVLVNNSAEQILGFPKEEAIGRNDQELLDPTSAAMHDNEDHQVVDRGVMLEFADQWLTNRYGTRLVRGWKQPLLDARGNTTHLLCISEDVTEHWQREQALRLIMEGTASKTGEAFFQSCVRYLAEVLRVSFALVTEFTDDSKQRVRTLAVWGNGNIWENFTYDLPETPCNEVMSQEVCYYPSGLQDHFPHDIALVAMAAESYLGIPLVGASGEVLGHLAVMDVRPMEPDDKRELILKIFAARAGAEVERQRVETALRIAKDAAEAANRAKSTFLANMSHELRTPLNSILGFAQIMERDGNLAHRHRQFLATINRSGEHLLDLINDVLEMSKIEAGRVSLNPTPFDLLSLLQTLREMFQMRAEARQLALHFDLAAHLPQYVLTDEGKLRQVLINLLGNAVKFTDRGQITLRVRVEPAPEKGGDRPLYLRFAVEDTGRGIATSDMARLFQPFVQTLSSSQSREGTGLGLAISRQFVRLMGGDLHCISTPGQGSTFWFEIGVTEPSAAEVPHPTPVGRVMGLAPEQTTYRILVVDDREENRDVITQLLAEVGFEVQTAGNGREAIAQWQRWHPHLIWMDMRMPVLDGYEATRQIRALEAVQEAANSSGGNQPQRTKIIALTASAFEEQRSTILAAGCDDLVRKPFREHTIFETMTAHLGVQYLYSTEELPSSPLQPSASASLEVPAMVDLSVMHPRWVAALRQAALEVDGDRILELIEHIPEIHSDLANALTQLVRQYNFDAILELM